MRLGEQFAALFAGLPRAYGVYRIDDPGTPAGQKKKGEASTLQKPVTTELWEEHLRGEIQLGIVPIRDDGTCVFAAIDVDDYKLDLIALERKALQLKLPLVIVRSKSGGAHCYVFFKEPVAAARVRDALVEWSAALGHGGVEIFPKQSQLRGQKDTGNWINMPYCGGDASDRHALLQGEPVSMARFLELAEQRKIGAERLAALEEATTPTAPDLLTEGPPCLVALAASGAPEGTRNSSLFNYGVYCRKRWPDDWQERVAEMNTRFISPPLDGAEVAQIVAHLERKEYSYKCSDRPINAFCQRALCLKRTYGIGPADAQEYFGIDLRNIIRLETALPEYYADFKGKRVRFNPEHIASQAKFRELLISQVNDSFMPIPNARWHQFAIKLCADAQVVEAPEETKEGGDIFGWLEEYCTEGIPAQDWSDCLDGQVYECDGRMFFRHTKFMNSYRRETRNNTTTDEAFRLLRPHGAESLRREIEGKFVKLWSVPAFRRSRARNDKDTL